MTFNRFRSKFGNKKQIVDGMKFDSQLEASRYMELKMLDRAGEITDLQMQVRFTLKCGDKPLLIRSKGYPNGRIAKYVADFVYTDVATGKEIIEDVKGMRTPEYLLKRAVMESMGFSINEITRVRT